MSAFASSSLGPRVSDAAERSRIYSDVNGVAQLKELNRSDSDAAIQEVSKQFESMLVQMMLKDMRKANKVFAEGNFLSGGDVGFYQDMLDDQWSLELTRGEGLGFADQMAHQLGGDDRRREVSSADVGQLTREAFGLPAQRSTLDKVIAITDKYSVAASESSTSVSQANEAAAVGVSDQNDVETVNQQSDVKVHQAIGLASPDRFETPEQFVATLMPYASEAAKDLGVEPEVLIAQAALETGWGQHFPRSDAGRNSHNLFGIKADSRWQGDSIQRETMEYHQGQPIKITASFRQYDSYQDSFSDYANFIADQARYQHALEQGKDSSAYLRGLQTAGYATDPQYAEKIESILNRQRFSGVVSDSAQPNVGKVGADNAAARSNRAVH